MNTVRDLRLVPMAIVAALIVPALVLLVPGTRLSHAQGPELQGGRLAATSPGIAFTYQGYLTDASGNPVNGSCDFRFRLYDAASSGAQVGSDQVIPGVTMNDGYFCVGVDLGADAFNGDARWLEVAIKLAGDPGYTAMPRQAVRPVPYALYAVNAPWDGLTGVPLAFADGTDDDTTYTADTGLRLSGTTFYLDIPYAHGGGRSNSASGWAAVVAGGYENSADGDNATVAGGLGNSADQIGASVGGGVLNVADATGATIAGGYENQIVGHYAAVGGGSDNVVSGGSAVVSGGYSNTVSADYGTVGGGSLNTAAGIASTVPGGRGNLAEGSFGFAAGRRAKALHDGAFVWGDSNDEDISSTGDDQFLIRAAGGVGIGTNAPATQLHLTKSADGNAANLASNVALFENTATTDVMGPDVLALKITNVSDPAARSNFITFFDSDGSLAAIQGNGAGGVTYMTTGGDFAEYLPQRDVDEVLMPGDVVGVHEGLVSRATDDGDQVLVVATSPAFVGNAPPEHSVAGKALVSLLGQVPVKVRGPVRAGDYIVPSGRDDGTGIAMSPERLTPAQLGAVVGCACESIGGEGVNRVTVLVGLPQGRLARMVLQAQATRIEALEQRLTSLEAVLAQQQEGGEP